MQAAVAIATRWNEDDFVDETDIAATTGSRVDAANITVIVHVMSTIHRNSIMAVIKLAKTSNRNVAGPTSVII